MVIRNTTYKRIPTGLGMLSPVPVGIANYWRLYDSYRMVEL